jgi:hypothetical protein
MLLRKLFAAGVAGAVLGIQLIIVVFPIDAQWYWPFVTYPMYSAAHYRTDFVSDFRLRARPCAAAPASPVSLGARDMGMSEYMLREELDNVVRAATATPLDTIHLAERTAFIDALVRRIPGIWCEVEIWERRYPNTGAVTPNTFDTFPWHLSVRWPVGMGGGARGWTPGDRISPNVAPIPSLPPLSAAYLDARRQ